MVKHPALLRYVRVKVQQFYRNRKKIRKISSVEDCYRSKTVQNRQKMLIIWELERSRCLLISSLHSLFLSDENDLSLEVTHQQQRFYPFYLPYHSPGEF
ncbi:hypothetical protein HUJ05_004997 [Dendroctonus ponderosae]|nr:hypothetical protein HUJ05_004997 [Dendroctonus ponderosae]